jgi:hypothetical protein
MRPYLLLALLAASCGPPPPARVPIDRLLPESQWEGKVLTITGGRVERVHREYVTVLDPGRAAERVDLLCYFPGGRGAELEGAYRGQEVTVTGRVVGPFGMWAFPTMKLVECRFTLGDPPEGEKVAATRGRGQAEADRDVEAGKLLLRFRHDRRGAPAWFPAYQKLLKDRGVEADVRPEAGPISGLHPDDREYNEVMTAAIEKRHGAGVLAELQKQAGGPK